MKFHSSRSNQITLHSLLIAPLYRNSAFNAYMRARAQYPFLFLLSTKRNSPSPSLSLSLSLRSNYIPFRRGQARRRFE